MVRHQPLPLRSALLLLLLGAGCPAPPPAVRLYPPPTASELYAALTTRARAIETLRTETKVDSLGDKGQRAKVSVTMLLARGGKMRFEVQSPFGGTLATLTSDGRNFALLDVRANRLLVGPAHACNVARLLRVWLEPDDVVAVLTGGAPLAGTPTGVSWDPHDGGREVLELTTPTGNHETIRLAAQDRLWDVVSAEERDPQGKIVWRLSHSGFEKSEVGSVRLPKFTAVEDPSHHADVRVRFRRLEPNVPLAPDLFQLTPPAGLQPEPVDCQ